MQITIDMKETKDLYNLRRRGKKMLSQCLLACVHVVCMSECVYVCVWGGGGGVLLFTLALVLFMPPSPSFMHLQLRNTSGP